MMPIRARFLASAAVALAIFTAPAMAQGAPDGLSQVDISALRADLSTNSPARQAFTRLERKARVDGGVKVLVRLNQNFQPDNALGLSQRMVQRQSIRAGTEGLMARLGVGRRGDGSFGGGAGVDAVTTFDTVPLVAMRANSAALQKLVADGAVAAIEEDVPVPPVLAQSVPLINADDVKNAGFGGAGWAVAVLDSGVDKNHPFLVGRVVSEACYSTNSGSAIRSLCPGGVTASTASGSGLDCPNTVTGCGHGTHVAGIAAGRGGGSSGVSYNGVAPDASIIAVKVFTQFNNSSCGTQPRPCILSYTSDQIKGLERVYALRTTYNIASVNMSLGGGQYTSACDTNSLKPIIDNLRSAGIATVIASGNNGFTNAISAPACISSAIAVGSTTKSDVISSFSNSSTLVDLLAPGSTIASSYKGGYASLSGTSMATPHVAGAFALLKHKLGNQSVTTLENALKSTGVNITDTRPGGGVVKPRINVQAAAGL